MQGNSTDPGLSFLFFFCSVRSHNLICFYLFLSYQILLKVMQQRKRLMKRKKQLVKFLVSKYLKKGCILMSIEWISLSIAGGGKEE